MSVRRASLLAWLLEQSPFGVAWCDGSGHVEVNATGAELLGLAERQLDQVRWANAVRMVDSSGCLLEPLARPLAVALAGKTVPRTRYQVIRPDGSRIHVDVEATPIKGEAGAVAMFEDVSWSLDSERRQVEWVAALGHELGGGLTGLSTAIAVAGRMLERDLGRTRHNLALAQREARLMVRLVSDFLDAAKLGVGALDVRLETVDVDVVLGELIEVAEASDPRHQLEKRIEPGLRVRADAGRLKQILANLLSNAAKYSNPGRLILGAREDEGRILVWLTDEGPGIAESSQSHLFQRFHRLPSQREGSGLGLWISRELALRMGGELWVRSGEGSPTTFVLALPAAASVDRALDEVSAQV
jgi:signal transduction histidine kinase